MFYRPTHLSRASYARDPARCSRVWTLNSVLACSFEARATWAADYDLRLEQWRCTFSRLFFPVRTDRVSTNRKSSRFSIITHPHGEVYSRNGWWWVRSTALNFSDKQRLEKLFVCILNSIRGQTYFGCWRFFYNVGNIKKVLPMCYIGSQPSSNVQICWWAQRH